MALASQIFNHLAQTLGGLYIIAIILRFSLQLARADFYNPISQGIVSITNPVLIPLRRIIPSLFGLDTASIILVLLIQLILGEINFFIAYQEFYNPLAALAFGALGLVKLCIYTLYGIGLVVMISSFVAPHSHHPIIMLSRQLLEPLSRPIQKIIPPMGGMDLSLFFIFICVSVLNMILDNVAYQLQITQTGLSLLVIGL